AATLREQWRAPPLPNGRGSETRLAREQPRDEVDQRRHADALPETEVVDQAQDAGDVHRAERVGQLLALPALEVRHVAVELVGQALPRRVLRLHAVTLLGQQAEQVLTLGRHVRIDPAAVAVLEGGLL